MVNFVGSDCFFDGCLMSGHFFEMSELLGGFHVGRDDDKKNRPYVSLGFTDSGPFPCRDCLQKLIDALPQALRTGLLGNNIGAPSHGFD